MKCWNCGTQINGKPVACPSCGISLKGYRKMVYQSNGLYNSALERTRKKDLSGAILTLKKCLELNKYQIQARNLYGLILYETGEFHEAARQWQLSMAFDPEDKQAPRLYKKAFGNKSELNKINSAVQKYNTALHCVKGDSLDMAEVQLKNVLSSYPHFAKAAHLMALISIKQEDYARACRVLKPVLERNMTDLQAQIYTEEAAALAGSTLKNTIKEQEEREARESQDVIIPPYSEKNELLHDFWCIAGGLLLGVLACTFLIFPSFKQRMTDNSNQEIMSYGDELYSKEVQIMSLEEQIEDLNKQVEEAQNSLEAYTGENGILDAYADLIASMTYYINDEYLEAVKSFTAINPEAVNNSVYQAAYNDMSAEFEENGLQYLYNEGRSAYKKRKFEDAKEYFLQCLKLKPDYPEVIYWTGLCYLNLNDREQAQNYLYKVQKEYEDTVWARNAKKYMPYTETAETDGSSESGASGDAENTPEE